MSSCLVMKGDRCSHPEMVRTAERGSSHEGQNLVRGRSLETERIPGKPWGTWYAGDCLHPQS